MENLAFSGDITDDNTQIKVKLTLIAFMDENDTYIIYSPHMDLSGYGADEKAAKRSFEISLEEFLRHTRRKKTLSKVLMKLGWTFKGKPEHLRKAKLPPFSKLVEDNSYVSEILNKYPVTTTMKDYAIPAYA